MSPRTDSTHDQRSQPWTERCANKREKKKAVSGENEKRSRRKKKDGPPRKTRTGTREFTAEECMVSIQEHFRDVSDPRINRLRLHRLIDIIVISLCAVICSAESWKDIDEVDGPAALDAWLSDAGSNDHQRSPAGFFPQRKFLGHVTG